MGNPQGSRATQESSGCSKSFCIKVREVNKEVVITLLRLRPKFARKKFAGCIQTAFTCTGPGSMPRSRTEAGQISRNRRED